MFNFAAAVSERIRNFKSTKVQAFVPEAEDGFPAGGGGDKTQGYQRGTLPPTSGSDRWVRMESPPGRGVLQKLVRGGGTTGPGASRKLPETASRGDGGSSPGDERHLKSPRKKLQKRNFFTLRRTPWRPRQTKVQPLNIKASLSTRYQSSSRANGTLLASSSPSSSLKKSKQVVGHVSTAGEEATSSPVNYQVQSGLQSNLRLRRPWTARLRDLLLPRHRRKATAVVALHNTPGSTVDRQTGSVGDHRNHGHKSQGKGALMGRREAKGVNGKRAQTVRNQLGSDDVITSPKIIHRIDHHQLPGVPQSSLDSHFGSTQDESDNDGSGSTLGHEYQCVLTGCGDQPHAAVRLPPTTSCASSVRKIDATTASNVCDDVSKKDAACSSSSKRQRADNGSASKGDAPSSAYQGVKIEKQQPPKPPKLPNREKEEAIFREHRFALGMNVGFIFESLVGCQGYPDCRWLDVMRSCILRKEELHSLVADGNQIVPYTQHEIETINMNAILAMDRIYQLNKLGFEHVKQKQNGVRNMRLFEPVEMLQSSVSAENEHQAHQGGVQSKRPSPQPALQKTVVTVTRERVKKGVVGTVSTNEENFLIPRKAALVKRQKDIFIPSVKTIARKPPCLEQKTEGGNREVHRVKLSQKTNAQTSNKMRREGNTTALKQVKVAESEKKVEPKNTSSVGIIRRATLCGMAKPKQTPAVKQAQKSTSKAVQATPAEKKQSSKASSLRLVSATPAAKNGSSTQPAVGTTIPKIAPSCLKKLIPNIPPYPELDPADLEHVMATDGTKTIIGRGNFAEIFLMRRLSDNTLVALKRLKKNHFRMTPDIDMLHEVTALKAVRHSPYFPRLYGVVDFRSYAQELLGDGSVDSARSFTKARFELSLLCRSEWLHVCRDITKAMMDLHRVGWLHNDLHTGNAMVCRNPPGSKIKWIGKIIDLGCAQSIYSLAPPWSLTKTQKQSFYQNAIQVAPEIVEGITSYTVQSDIYSLGRLFLTVAHEASSLSSLRLLGLSCMNRVPKLRPKLKTVYKKLNTICAKAKTAKNEQPLSYN